MLELMTSNNNLSQLEQLAILTKVRQEMAFEENPPDIKTILTQTNVMKIIQQLLSLDEGAVVTRYLKLESFWILINLAYGDEDDV